MIPCVDSVSRCHPTASSTPLASMMLFRTSYSHTPSWMKVMSLGLHGLTILLWCRYVGIPALPTLRLAIRAMPQTKNSIVKQRALLSTQATIVCSTKGRVNTFVKIFLDSISSCWAAIFEARRDSIGQCPPILFPRDRGLPYTQPSPRNLVGMPLANRCLCEYPSVVLREAFGP